jgi:hypothetical protein
VVLLLALFAVSASSVLLRRQLGPLLGLTDEWYVLGANLALSGTLGIDEHPIVTRPPGYPVFIATAFRTFDLVGGDPRRLGLAAYLERGQYAVYLAQALALASAGAVMFLWLSRFLTTRAALAAALLFGTNAYAVILAGLLHYDVLHLLCLVVSCAVFDRALEDPQRRPGLMLAAGLAWGLTTLVRPLTLALPPFLLMALWAARGRRWRQTLADAGRLALGMALVVAPYTLRNYVASGRFVLVNVQGWEALWGSTVVPLPRDPNVYHWQESLFRDHYLPLFTAVTGEAQYSLPTYLHHVGEIEAAVREQTLQNLQQRPGIYLHNALRSFLTFNLDINSVFVEAFRRIQGPEGPRALAGLFGTAPTAAWTPSWVTRAFSAWMLGLNLLAAVGAAIAIRRRERRLLLPGLVYACLALAHTLVYMDLMYYYSKLPFLFVFASYATDREPRGLLLALVAGTSAVLSALVLYG